MDLTDVLQMLGRAGRPQFDNSGVARIFTQDSKKDFYKHFYTLVSPSSPRCIPSWITIFAPKSPQRRS